MITPETFYKPGDSPDTRTKLVMWQKIEKELPSRKTAVWFIADRRSFIYGIAAAILLYFASVGAYTTITQSIEHAKPGAVRLDEAYQSAINGFEKIIPQLANNTAATDKDKMYIVIRREQIGKIDAAIHSLKQELGGGDLSPMTQRRLRQLYSMKLKVLQELIDQGEIEL